MNSRWLFIVVLTVLFVACNQEQIKPPESNPSNRIFISPGISRYPRIVSITPNNGAVAVNLDQEIRITFSRSMIPATVYRAFEGGGVYNRGSMYMTDNDTVLHINPEVWSPFNTLTSFDIVGKDRADEYTPEATAINGYGLQKTYYSSFRTLSGWNTQVTVDKLRINNADFFAGKMCGYMTFAKNKLFPSKNLAFLDITCANPLSVVNGSVIDVSPLYQLYNTSLTTSPSDFIDIGGIIDGDGEAHLGNIYFPFALFPGFSNEIKNNSSDGRISITSPFLAVSEAQTFGSFETNPSLPISILFHVEKLYNLP